MILDFLVGLDCVVHVWVFKFRFLFPFGFEYWFWGFVVRFFVGFDDFGLGLMFSCYKTGFSGFGFLAGNFDLG